MTTREDVFAHLVGQLRQVAHDGEVEGGITEQTRLFADLNFESLDLVVLGAALQEHYGRTFPFAEFFAQIGQRQQKDLTVGEWLDFLYQQLRPELTVTAHRGRS
jgi:acyl carrier protein